MRSYRNKILKWIRRVFYLLGFLIVTAVCLLLFLHTAPGKSLVRKKVESYLQEKWQTAVTIGNIDYALPNWLTLERVTILDKQNDTLLHGGYLHVRIRLLKLLSNTVDITGISLKNIFLNLRREKQDTAFNAQFILDAFASSGTDTTAAVGKPMRLSVRQLSLDDVRFNVNDKKEKFFLVVNLGQLVSTPDSLYPEKSIFRFHELGIRHCQVTVIDSSGPQKLPETETVTNSDPSPLLFSLKQLFLHRVLFTYQKPRDHLDYRFQVDSLQLNAPLFDLGQSTARLKNIRISNSSVTLANAMVPDAVSKSQKPVSETAVNTPAWNLRADTIALVNNSFRFHDPTAPAKKGIDPRHFDVENIYLEARQTVLDSSGIFSQLEDCRFLFNRQFRLQGFHTVIRSADSCLHLDDLAFATDHSRLTTKGSILIPLAAGAPSSRFRIEPSVINYGEVLLLQPALEKVLPLSLQPSDQLTFSGNFSGNLQGLQAEELRLALSRNLFHLAGSAAFRTGHSGPALLADVKQVRVNRNLLGKELLQQLKKDNIQLPEELILSGKLAASKELLKTDLILQSVFGQLSINGTAANISHPDRMRYDVLLNAKNFETGKWIGLDSIAGKITGLLMVKGEGLQGNSLATSARLSLASAELYQRRLANINLQAGIHWSAFQLNLQIRDSALQTDMDLQGRIGPDYAADGTIHINHADFKALGLAADSLSYKGNIRLSASYLPPQALTAKLELDSNYFIFSGKQVSADRLALQCQSGVDSTVLSVNTPFLAMQLTGNYPIGRLAAELTSFSHHLSPFENSPAGKAVFLDTSSQTNINLVLREDSVLKAFVPKLSLAEPLRLHATYRPGQTDSLLLAELKAPNIRYGQYEGHDLYLRAETKDSVLQLALKGSEVLTGTKRFTQPRITGTVGRRSVLVQAAIDDSAGKEYMSAGLELKKENEETTIRLLDNLVLNYNQWSVPAGNLIRIRKDGYIINQLTLKNKDQVLAVNSEKPDAVSPIVVKATQLNIGNLANLLSPGDSLAVKGLLNADMVVQQPVQKIPVVTGSLQTTDLAYRDIAIGDFAFSSHTIGDSLLLKGSLSGTNQLDVSGTMDLTKKAFAVQAQWKRLDMKMVQGFTREFLSQLSGNVTANVQVAGTVSEPRVSGEINLDSLTFALKALNTAYRINKQKLVFENSALQFGQFSLTDSAGHPLTISGKIADVLSPAQTLDLNVATRDFVVLSAPRRPGNLLYGTGIIDAQVSLKGTSQAPVVEGSASLQGKSNFHVVLAPQTTAGRNQKEGIIFVDMDTLNLLAGQRTQVPADTVAVAKTVAGLKFNLNVKVDKDATLTILIDPSNKDELVLKGEAQLNAGIGKDGSSALTGVYRLQSGYYKMDNLLLRGKFLVTKGSTVTFNGDPSSAEADIATEYEIEASPKGLLNYKDDNASLPPRVSFAVIFQIKGTLSKPELSFDIQLKPGRAVLQSTVKSDIEHALNRLRNDVAEMNKQVFSLLLTKQFVATGEQTSLESSNLNANNALKEGVSSFLSSAMNQMADQLIKGVDVDVNVKTYKTADDPTSKTDLGVSMSKDLFENRLVIRIEENFPVGNSTASAQKSGSQYVPDITSTYKLSKDGRLQLRAYQKNEYDAVVQGYFTQYGINFTVELAYDKFKELIKRRKKNANETE